MRGLLSARGCALLLSGIVSLHGAAAREVRIDTTYMAFAPAAVDVEVGDRVTWTNHSGVMHEIYFPVNPSASGEPRLRYTLTGRSSFSIVVAKPGEFDYFCRWHGMYGRIRALRSSARR